MTHIQTPNAQDTGMIAKSRIQPINNNNSEINYFSFTNNQKSKNPKMLEPKPGIMTGC